jgi:hypothetical protein
MCLLQRGGNHLPQTTVKDASPYASARAHAWLPSLSAMIWITLFLGLNLTPARHVLISADSDPGWHRRMGEWMIQHHAIVRENDFLHTHQGPYLPRDWLSEVIYATASNQFGWSGFVLVAATLIATCYWLLHRQLMAEGCDAFLATMLVLVAMLAGSMHWLARPLLFTQLLTLVFAVQLRRFQEGQISPVKLFAVLVPLMVLWVNLHAAFMTGLVLIGMHTLGSTATAWWRSTAYTRPKMLFALLLICFVASFANPNFWKIHAQILNFFESREVSNLTTEFASPNFHTVGMQGFLLLLLVLGVTLLVARPLLSATDVLLVGGWGCLVLFSARNVPIFGLVVTPLLARWLTNFAQTEPGSWWRQRYRQWAGRLTTIDRASGNVLPIAAAIVCLLLILAKPQIAGGNPVITTDFSETRYPTVVVAHLREHPEIVHGEMFNSFLWGGYLEFALPERPAFIDSRAEFYGPEVLEDFFTVNEPKRGWEGVFAKYNVGWTLLPVQHPLNRILELNPHWSLVFSNQQALVFSRVS